MYGLVNKAVEQMVRSSYGDELWETIRRHAAIAPESFVSMQQYSDDVTYRLVTAASAVLGRPRAEVLRAFGQYWMLYTGSEGYGELLDMTGASLVEFLLNLDLMHGRVGQIYPELRPPSFRCSDITTAGLVLHYYSERRGLAPMVVGLLEGLAVRFKTPITIGLLASRDEGADHDQFRISFAQAPPAGGP
jgi:Haem-NO-binding